ncbi:PspC domain-containing protein [Eubacteriales bacterium OttesenSCG-928-G02]|nr:PspC domain-containing protein [Eubacteriales bacterium OttesenSCG-928-G02]
MAKTLYKINEGKMLCGVCKGISEYLNLDVNIIRLLFIVVGFTGVGIVLYLAAAILLPEKPAVGTIEGSATDKTDNNTDNTNNN